MDCISRCSAAQVAEPGSPSVSEAPTRSLLAPVKESNPPAWPASVYVIEPDGKFAGSKQELFDFIFSEVGKYSAHPWHGGGGYFFETGREFSSKRTAVLLKPGVHRAKFNVGYYHSLAGLGMQPGDVQLDAFEVLNGVGTSGVQTGPDPGALNNFWRSVENLQTAPGRTIQWFVSQASPLRRVHVQGELKCSGTVGGGRWDHGWASGGYLADSKIDGGVNFGSQQQFFSRNIELGAGMAFEHGSWSNVIVGSAGRYRSKPNQLLRPTEVERTERIAEKPFIAYEEQSGRYSLVVPRLEFDTLGISWQRQSGPGGALKIDFESVYVAEPGASPGKVINAKLAEGKAVVLSPGIYMLSEPISVTRSGAVILGLGLATLMPAADAPFLEALIVVADGLEDVRIAGMLLEAGPQGSGALLRWGTAWTQRPAGRPAAAQGLAAPEGAGLVPFPGVLSDVICRVGGASGASGADVSTDQMIQLNAPGVICDHLWLWRADHQAPGWPNPVKFSRNPVFNCLEVNGDGVLCYGLFAEHVLRDAVVWNGENGKVFLFQCELPYDVTQQNFGDAGYVGFRIAPHVQKHELRGAGVYSYFRDNVVEAKSGFVVPEGRPGIVLQNLFVVFLNGSGGIRNVMNGRGRGCTEKEQGRPMWL